MPSGASSDDHGDDDILQRIANLSLNVSEDTAPPPPYPGTPRPRDLSAPHPSPGSVTTPRNLTVYRYESPARSGYTTRWSEAGVASQGVDDAIVEAVQRRPKKPRRKKGAYVVFAGRECGVFLSWEHTHSLVSRINDNIYRGYSSVAEAEAAFAYALARGWTRTIPGPQTTISQLPVPITASSGAETAEANPLHGNDIFDDTWFVVYRGVIPGVYRSLLECQLNTLGIRNALHKSYPTKSEALSMYAAAVARGEVSVLTPVYIP